MKSKFYLYIDGWFVLILLIHNSQTHMIKGKYKPVDIIKQRHDKIIEKALLANAYDNKYYVIKSYPIHDAKSI